MPSTTCPRRRAQGCRALERAVADTKRDLAVPGRRAADVVRALVDRIGLRTEIDTSSGSAPMAARRWGNVESLFATFGRRDTARAESGDSDKSLASFLHALTLDFGSDEEKPEDVVTLSTLHGAKGLEFDVVFLLGCEEGLLPHSRTTDTRVTDAVAQDPEEERRLFYVGVTRAKELLFLSRCKARVMRGKPVPRTPSRFLLDIPEELVEEAPVKDEALMSTGEMVESANALLAALDALR